MSLQRQVSGLLTLCRVCTSNAAALAFNNIFERRRDSASKLGLSTQNGVFSISVWQANVRLTSFPNRNSIAIRITLYTIIYASFIDNSLKNEKPKRSTVSRHVQSLRLHEIHADARAKQNAGV